MASFLTALAFLTILPIRLRELPSAQSIARSRFWYPLVGLILGAILGTWTFLVTAWFRAPPLGAFLVLLAWVVVTGALHLDGFCDLCDGLFGGHTPEDRLRIMKDPHRGSFGLAGGILLLLGKFVALQELIDSTGAGAYWRVAAAVLVARCLVLSMAAGARYPRQDGTGKILIEATRGWEAVLFSAVAAACAALLAACFGTAQPPGLPTSALSLFLPPLLGVMALKGLCLRRLGGVTGDSLGAAIEVAEWACLLGALP